MVGWIQETDTWTYKETHYQEKGYGFATYFARYPAVQGLADRNRSQRSHSLATLQTTPNAMLLAARQSD